MEVSDVVEVGEGALPGALPFVVNGLLGAARERDSFAVAVKKGVPLAVTSLSAQLGGPYLDTVLTLRDAGGKKLAESTTWWRAGAVCWGIRIVRCFMCLWKMV